MSLKEKKSGKVPFGLQNGKLYEVSQVERGLACNCICPSCKKPLVAKKGDQKEDHFSHAVNHSCETGKETAIHLAAKQIIFQNKSVFLPSIDIDGGEKNYGVMNFDEIILEKCIDECSDQLLLIPDITAIVQRNNNPIKLYIEIAVTHFCEQKKINAFKKKKYSSIEIDLSTLMKEKNVTFDVIEKIINQGKNTTWIYNQREEIEKEKIKKREEKEKRIRENIRNQKQNQMKRLINLYNQAKIQNRDDNQLMKETKRILGINNLNDLPIFISEPSDIDALYPLDGRLVRLYIYEQYILLRKYIPKLKERAFGAKGVIQYLKSEKKFFPNKFIYEGNKLMYDEDAPYLYEKKTLHDVKVIAGDAEILKWLKNNNTPNFNIKKIISNYLFELKNAGFLEYNGDYFFKLPNEYDDKKIYEACHNKIDIQIVKPIIEPIRKPISKTNPAKEKKLYQSTPTVNTEDSQQTTKSESRIVQVFKPKRCFKCNDKPFLYMNVGRVKIDQNMKILEIDNDPFKDEIKISNSFTIAKRKENNNISSYYCPECNAWLANQPRFNRKTFIFKDEIVIPCSLF